MVNVTVYMDVCGCVLSQEASDHGLIVREIVFPECSSDFRTVVHIPVAHSSQPSVDRFQWWGAVGIKIFIMPRVLHEDTYPLYPAVPL